MVKSPCINECCLGEDNICVSCGRPLESIINWSDMSEEQQLEVIENIEVPAE